MDENKAGEVRGEVAAKLAEHESLSGVFGDLAMEHVLGTVVDLFGEAAKGELRRRHGLPEQDALEPEPALGPVPNTGVWAGAKTMAELDPVEELGPDRVREIMDGGE
jgi:hypothetical protein